MTKLLPVVSDAIERMDDSNLRTVIHEARGIFEQEAGGDAPEGAEVQHRLASEISCLCDVVLFRDLRHIVTLFQKNNLTAIAKEELGIENEEKRNRFLTFVLQNVQETFSIFGELLNDFKSLGFDHPVSILYEVIEPKVYAVDRDKKPPFEAGVWIRDPRGPLIAVDDASVSSALHSMARERANDAKLRIYLAGQDVRNNTDALKKVEALILEAIRSELAAFNKT